MGEGISANSLYKDYMKSKKSYSSDEFKYRFTSTKVAKRYLGKFSLVDKIFINIGVHPKTIEFNAAKNILNMFETDFSLERNLYFLYCFEFHDYVSKKFPEYIHKRIF